MPRRTAALEGAWMCTFGHGGQQKINVTKSIVRYTDGSAYTIQVGSSDDL